MVYISCSRLPFPFLLFPSVVTGEKGTSVSSLSEGEGDSTEREAGPGPEVIGLASVTTDPRGEEAVELGPLGGQERGRDGRPPRGDGYRPRG